LVQGRRLNNLYIQTVEGNEKDETIQRVKR
jgi:hypothetical protein